MTKWQEVKLGDVCDVRDGTHDTPKESSEGKYLVTSKHIKGGKIDLSSAYKISLEDFNFVNQRSKVDKWDILISMIGTVGEICLVSEYPDFAIKNVGLIKTGNEYLAKYLYYYLKSPTAQNDILSRLKGTTQQYLSLGEIRNFPVIIPPLEMQKKIAGVLGALDDKIELNNKINNNLEQQAQALFKSWFVDIKETSQNNEKFGYIPQNATVKKVGELPVFITDYVANGSFASLKENVTLYQNKNYAYFIRNTDLKSNSFEVYVDEHSYKFLSKSSLFGNEIIISNVGDVGSVFLCPKLDLPMTLGNNIIMLRAEKNSYLGFYLYIWFKWSYGQELIQGIKGGSAQPKFNKTDFKGLPVILPSQQQLKEFNEAVTPMFNKISQNRIENTRLAAIRDALLPKLMNGEIDVSNVDISALTSTDKLSFTED